MSLDLIYKKLIVTRIIIGLKISDKAPRVLKDDGSRFCLLVKVLDVLLKVVGIFAGLKTIVGGKKNNKNVRKDKKKYRR